MHTYVDKHTQIYYVHIKFFTGFHMIVTHTVFMDSTSLDFQIKDLILPFNADYFNNFYHFLKPSMKAIKKYGAEH